MLVIDLFESHHNLVLPNEHAAVLADKCSSFLRESAGLPLYKSLPATYQDFQKVKVRQQKKQDAVTEAFNQAFGDEHVNLRQRAIFTYCVEQEQTLETEGFFVFPTNGYKFMYCKEVENSSQEYQQVLGTLFEAYNDDNTEVYEIVCDLLKRTYVKEGLIEGILAKSEIIIYGVPHYYVVRCSSVPSYGTLYNQVNKG